MRNLILHPEEAHSSVCQTGGYLFNSAAKFVTTVTDGLTCCARTESSRWKHYFPAARNASTRGLIVLSSHAGV